MRVLAINAYHGGSHREFLTQWIDISFQLKVRAFLRHTVNAVLHKIICQFSDEFRPPYMYFPKKITVLCIFPNNNIRSVLLSAVC